MGEKRHQRYWGLLLLGFSLVMITVEGCALLGMAAILILTGFEASPFLVILWSVLALMGLGVSTRYLRSIDLRPAEERNSRREHRSAEVVNI